MQRFCVLIAVFFICFVSFSVAKAQGVDSNMYGVEPAASSQSNLQGSVPAGFSMTGSLPSGQGTAVGGATPLATQQLQTPLFVPGNSPFSNLYNASNRPAWAQGAYGIEGKHIPPFGANLFQGFFAGTYHSGMNDRYIITPGDRILVHIWGASSFDDVLMVDQQGNIFLPEVGPVAVGGISNSSLQSVVTTSLSTAYRSNVNAYATLLSAQPVAVYVTGFVKNPGRYAGGLTDSVLYYIDRAGGILPERGSYRNITIQRDGKKFMTVDLYNFILKGNVYREVLRDGDVVMVGPKGKSILATGLIPQHASYETLSKSFKGLDLNMMSNPEPAVSNVSVIGSRDSVPFHIYLTLKEFEQFRLDANDMVEYLADRPSGTIMVSVSGATLGASRFPITKTTSLRSLLAHVPVDTKLAQVSSIYLKRRSVAEQQKKAIKDSLWRLEHSVLTATSSSVSEADIRVKEAGLVQNFVTRASQLEPDGVVVITQNGQTSDIMLEDGDEIIIPQYSDVVQISGEVMMPKAVIYSPKYTLKDYIANSGGYTDRADKDNVLVVHANGSLSVSSKTVVAPGDLLLVLPKYDSKGMQIFKDITQVLFQIAVATRAIVSL